MHDSIGYSVFSLKNRNSNAWSVAAVILYNISQWCVIVVIVVSSIDCESGTIPLKIRKQSEYAAEDESFQIMLDSQLVYSSPPFVSFEYREFDICIQDSPTRQYWLQLRDR